MDIIVQAATDIALINLLTTHGILTINEYGVIPVKGITYSHIGEALLDGISLEGRYAFIGIDREIFGEATTEQTILNLTPHIYTGPPIRIRLGGSNYTSVEIPEVVTMAQARLALLAINKLDEVDSAINAIPDIIARKAAQIEWEYSGTVHRNHGLVLQIGPILGLSDSQIDNLFIEAYKYR